MGYLIEIDNLEDYKWLKGMFDRTVEGMSRNSKLAESVEEIMRISEAINNAKQTRQKSTEPAPERYRYDICKNHPYSSLKNRPRTDCKGCWKGYKDLHPNEYDVARRDFLRKQKEKAKS